MLGIAEVRVGRRAEPPNHPPPPRPTATGKRPQGASGLPGPRGGRGEATRDLPEHQLQEAGGQHAGSALQSRRKQLQRKDRPFIVLVMKLFKKIIIIIRKRPQLPLLTDPS